jgi:hypothetical protein
MPGYPKHGLPPVRKQLERCVKAAKLQLARLLEEKEQTRAD